MSGGIFSSLPDFFAHAIVPYLHAVFLGCIGHEHYRCGRILLLIVLTGFSIGFIGDWIKAKRMASKVPSEMKENEGERKRLTRPEKHLVCKMLGGTEKK